MGDGTGIFIINEMEDATVVKAAAIVVSNVGAPPSVDRAMEEQSLARRHHAANSVGGLGVVVAQQLAGAGGQSRGRSGRVGGVGKSQHFGACVCRRRRRRRQVAALRCLRVSAPSTRQRGTWS